MGYCGGTTNGYICRPCKAGFTGDKCQYSTNPVHCSNNGEVQPSGACLCADGVAGDYCQCMSPDTVTGECLQCATAKEAFTGTWPLDPTAPLLYNEEEGGKSTLCTTNSK